MVRLYRTSSIYSSFGVVQVQRTSSNHIIADIAKCVEFFNLGSGWFDCTEPPLSTDLEEKQGVQGAFALVRGTPQSTPKPVWRSVLFSFQILDSSHTATCATVCDRVRLFDRAPSTLLSLQSFRAVVGEF